MPIAIPKMEKVEQFVPGTSIEKNTNTTVQFRFVKIKAKSIQETLEDELISFLLVWTRTRANNIVIGDTPVILTRWYAIKNETDKELFFYCTFKKPESTPPRPQNATVNMRIPRIFSQFDIRQDSRFESSEIEIYVGDRESFRENLIDDLLNHKFLDGKTSIPFPNMGSISNNKKILLLRKFTLETLEKCFPEYINEFYGILFYILNKKTLSNESVEALSLLFGVTNSVIEEAINIALNLFKKVEDLVSPKSTTEVTPEENTEVFFWNK